MDSFDDRIDDDLFESIISYLPIEDKIRYESVSKRFQRLVFKKQNDLGISWRALSINSVDKILDLLIKNLNINVSTLERLLKKFRFINAIKFDILFWNPSEVLNTITQNCNHLTSIDFDFIGVNFEELKQFCQKFGQQLRHISFPSHYNDVDSGGDVIKYLLKHSPNLLSVKCLKVEDLNEFEFKRLKKIKLKMDFQSNLMTKSLICAQNLKYLENMSIRLISKHPNKVLFNDLAKLKNLKHLKIESKFSESRDQIWAKHIETIASNCFGLQCFEFKLRPEDSQEFNPNTCFQSISYFRGLKALRFRTNCKKPIIDLSALKNCKSLELLELSVKFISDRIFGEIHLIVPQLKGLSIESFKSLKMTIKGLKSIAKLKYLTQLSFKHSKFDITSKDLKKLVDSWHRLKYVEIIHCPIPKSCPRYEKRKLLKIIENIQKYRKRIETREEVI